MILATILFFGLIIQLVKNLQDIKLFENQSNDYSFWLSVNETVSVNLNDYFGGHNISFQTNQDENVTLSNKFVINYQTDFITSIKKSCQASDNETILFGLSQQNGVMIADISSNFDLLYQIDLSQKLTKPYECFDLAVQGEQIVVDCRTSTDNTFVYVDQKSYEVQQLVQNAATPQNAISRKIKYVKEYQQLVRLQIDQSNNNNSYLEIFSVIGSLLSVIDRFALQQENLQLSDFDVDSNNNIVCITSDGKMFRINSQNYQQIEFKMINLKKSQDMKFTGIIAQNQADQLYLQDLTYVLVSTDKELIRILLDWDSTQFITSSFPLINAQNAYFDRQFIYISNSSHFSVFDLYNKFQEEFYAIEQTEIFHSIFRDNKQYFFGNNTIMISTINLPILAIKGQLTQGQSRNTQNLTLNISNNNEFITRNFSINVVQLNDDQIYNLNASQNVRLLDFPGQIVLDIEYFLQGPNINYSLLQISPINQDLDVNSELQFVNKLIFNDDVDNDIIFEFNQNQLIQFSNLTVIIQACDLIQEENMQDCQKQLQFNATDPILMSTFIQNQTDKMIAAVYQNKNEFYVQLITISKNVSIYKTFDINFQYSQNYNLTQVMSLGPSQLLLVYSDAFAQQLTLVNIDQENYYKSYDIHEFQFDSIQNSKDHPNLIIGVQSNPWQSFSLMSISPNGFQNLQIYSLQQLAGPISASLQKEKIIIISQNSIMEFKFNQLDLKQSIRYVRNYPIYGYTIQSSLVQSSSKFLYISAQDNNNSSVVLIYNSQLDTNAVLYNVIELSGEIKIIDNYYNYLMIQTKTSQIFYGVFDHPTITFSKEDETTERFYQRFYQLNAMNKQSQIQFNLTVNCWYQTFSIVKKQKQIENLVQFRMQEEDSNQEVSFKQNLYFDGLISEYNINCYDCDSKIHLHNIVNQVLSTKIYDQLQDFQINSNGLFILLDKLLLITDFYFTEIISFKLNQQYNKIFLINDNLVGLYAQGDYSQLDIFNFITNQTEKSLNIEMIVEKIIYLNDLLFVSSSQDQLKIFDSQYNLIYYFTKNSLINITISINTFDVIKTSDPTKTKVFMVDKDFGIRIFEITFNNITYNITKQWSQEMLSTVIQLGGCKMIKYQDIKLIDETVDQNQTSYRIFITTTNFHSYEMNINFDSNNTLIAPKVLTVFTKYSKDYTSIKNIVVTQQQILIPYYSEKLQAQIQLAYHRNSNLNDTHFNDFNAGNLNQQDNFLTAKSPSNEYFFVINNNSQIIKYMVRDNVQIVFENINQIQTREIYLIASNQITSDQSIILIQASQELVISHSLIAMFIVIGVVVVLGCIYIIRITKNTQQSLLERSVDYNLIN